MLNHISHVVSSNCKDQNNQPTNNELVDTGEKKQEEFNIKDQEQGAKAGKGADSFIPSLIKTSCNCLNKPLILCASCLSPLLKQWS